MYFICAEESKKRKLKGYNIIGYVPDIWFKAFKVLLRKLLYENLTFLYYNWNKFTSVGVSKEIYLLNYKHNGWIIIISF